MSFRFPLNQPEGGPEPQDPDPEPPVPPGRRAGRLRSRGSPQHLARIERYRQRIEQGLGIFAPPTPERPVSSLLEELSVKQISQLADRTASS